MVKAVKKFLFAALLLFVFSACGADEQEQEQGVEWLSPMLAVNLSRPMGRVYEGSLPVEIGNNDRENRGRIVTETPEEGEEPNFAALTAEELIENGAVRLTANFAYSGDETYHVRFRFRVDQFQGHSITRYALGAGSGVMILYQEECGTWRNVRRTSIGGQYTGGTRVQDFYALEINAETAADFAEREFYIIITEAVPFRVNDAGEPTDNISGYVITYQAERPDHDGHFHNFSVLLSSTVYLPVIS